MPAKYESDQRTNFMKIRTRVTAFRGAELIQSTPAEARRVSSVTHLRACRAGQHNRRVLFTPLLLALATVTCSTERSLAQEPAEVLGDGDKGATIGTLIYNTLNPKTPLPLLGTDDDALKKTAQNLGAGQCLQDAWKNGTASAAGLDGQAQQSSDCTPATQTPNDAAPAPQPSPQPSPQPQSTQDSNGDGTGTASPQTSPQSSSQPQSSSGNSQANDAAAAAAVNSINGTWNINPTNPSAISLNTTAPAIRPLAGANQNVSSQEVGTSPPGSGLIWNCKRDFTAVGQTPCEEHNQWVQSLSGKAAAEH